MVDARPTGPLLIGGYSSGGTVALEMARRLDERGRRPDLVVLLDSHFVSRLPLRPDRQAVTSWTQAGVREAKRQLALAEWAQALPLPMKDHNRRRAGQSREARARRRAGQTLPTHLRTRFVMSQVETALGRWVARPYDGPVLVVVTEPSPRLDAWRRLATDITYLPVEGTHDSFMRPPLVDLLADALAPYFAPADAAAAS